MSIKGIRGNPQKFKENQKNRYSDPNIIDIILEVDAKCVKEDYMISRLNQIKKIVTGHIRQAKNKIGDEHDNVQNLNEKCKFFEVEELANDIFDSLLSTIYDYAQTNKIKNIDGILSKLNRNELIVLSKYITKKLNNIDNTTKRNRDALIDNLCNILHKDVPINSDETYNTIIYEKKSELRQKYNHVDLCIKLDIIDTIHGSKLAGNRGYFLKGLGVKLNMALMMYAMDFLAKKGYKQMYVPHFLNSDVMEKLCQLQDFDETLYKINIGELDKDSNESSTKYLIATSEQPLTGFYMDYKFKPGELPVRFCGISTCYRKETGRHGRDTLGIYRVHQFEKTEQLCITEASESENMFNEMINNAQEFYDSLGLSYHVVAIVSGALNNAAAIKYDLEGYFAGSGTYRELVSCSNCTDYFSRKLNIKDKYGNYVHILNSTLCASTRTLCCILEQYQTEKGVSIPETLKRYMHDIELDYIPFK